MQVKDLLVLGNANFLGEARINGQAVALQSELDALKACLSITFTVSNLSYSALRGMTWFEWINSDYNVSNAFFESDGRVKIPGYAFVATNTTDFKYVTITDTIAASYAYMFSA